MSVPVRRAHPTRARTLPEVKHKTPCRECPFRRAAPKGWLGGGTVDEWMGDLTVGDCAFACHMAESAGKLRYCAGSMILMRNSLKSPRDPKFYADSLRYSADVERVFQWAHEFNEHHRGGPLEIKARGMLTELHRQKVKP